MSAELNFYIVIVIVEHDEDSLSVVTYVSELLNVALNFVCYMPWGLGLVVRLGAGVALLIDSETYAYVIHTEGGDEDDRGIKGEAIWGGDNGRMIAGNSDFVCDGVLLGVWRAQNLKMSWVSIE